MEKGLVKSLKKPIKILGDGELLKPLTVSAHKFTQTARSKIEAAGGIVEEISSVSGSLPTSLYRVRMLRPCANSLQEAVVQDRWWGCWISLVAGR